MPAVRKNDREEIRIESATYKGREFVNIRVWYVDGTGAYRPGRQGIAVRRALLPEFIEALESISEEEPAHP